jgi:hypothetical protein
MTTPAELFWGFLFFGSLGLFVLLHSPTLPEDAPFEGSQLPFLPQSIFFSEGSTVDLFGWLLN